MNIISLQLNNIYLKFPETQLISSLNARDQIIKSIALSAIICFCVGYLLYKIYSFVVHRNNKEQNAVDSVSQTFFDQEEKGDHQEVLHAKHQSEEVDHAETYFNQSDLIDSKSSSSVSSFNQSSEIEDISAQADVQSILPPDKLCAFLMDKVFSSQATMNLYQRAQEALESLNGLELETIVVDPSQTWVSGGICQWKEGKILISSSLPVNQAFVIYMFELANMAQADELDQVFENARQGLLSRDEYAMEMERIEHMTAILHTTTMKEAIDEQGKEWEKYDHYHHVGIDEMKYYNLQVDIGHTKFYLDQWDKLHPYGVRG